MSPAPEGRAAVACPSAIRPLAALTELALPRRCAGCGALGQVLCPDCVLDLARCLFVDGPRPVRPLPCPAGLGPTWAAGHYGGMLATLVRRYKDEDRRDLRAILQLPLAGAVLAGLRHAPTRLTDPVLVPVPTSRTNRRRRGDAPIADLVAALGRALGIEVVEALRPCRRVRDQAGLSAHDRAENLRGSMIPTAPGLALRGRGVIVVDDVLTTGATLLAARSAFADYGIDVAATAVIAVTARTTGGLRHKVSRVG